MSPTETVVLQSGLHVPGSVVQAAIKALGGSSSTGGRSGGRWVSLGDGTVPDRLRSFESYLNAITIPWVFQAGSTVAWYYAAAEFDIVAGRKAETIPPDDPALGRLLDLLDQPNAVMDGSELCELLCWHLILTGNAFLVMDNFNGFVDPLTGLREPTELYLLRPSKVRIVPDKKDYVKEFWYDMGNGVWKPYKPEDVIWFKKANPRDQYWGLGVIEAGEQTFVKQRAISRTETSFFDSGARVKGVLKYDGTLTDEQADELREQWRTMDEGQSGQFRTAILEGKMEYQAISSDLISGGPGMEVLAKMARDEVLTMFGVPKQKVGIFDEASYRSIEADSFFVAETMRPLMRSTNFPWTKLTRRFNKDWRYKYREIVVTDYLDKAQTAHFLAQSGCFARDEIREASGWTKWDETRDEKTLGNQIIGPVTMTVWTEDGPVQPDAPGSPGPEDETPPTPHSTDTPEGLKHPTKQSAAPKLSLPALGKKALAATEALDRQGQGPRMCSCPRDVLISHKAVTAQMLGICPQHRELVDETLRIGRERRYSLAQLREGVPHEKFCGVLGLLP